MPFVLQSLRGGLNNSDAAIGIPDDQCVVANNVEFNKSLLGERRRGTSAITLGTNIANKNRVPFLFRHLPTADETAAQLWALGVNTASNAYQLSYKDTSWHDVSISDTVSLTGFDQYRWQAVSLHGKLFFALNTDVDRLHVWDGTSFRRVGLPAHAAAPTGADTAGAGTFTGTRYYRTRSVDMPSSTVLRRSEPSAVLTKAPSGTKTGITVTRPTDVGEGTTHWELEASLDNANFYRIARTAIGTTTVDDTTDANAGYAKTYPLSEDIGDYTLLGSARYLTIDADRLVCAGNYEDTALGSRIVWTPVGKADGVGNDERSELDTDPTLDLDGFEGGPITGLSSTSAGSFFAFKINHIYKLVRTGARAQAYDVVSISKERGALHGSVVNGVDQLGHSCVYFLDSSVGPCRFGANGLEWCGSDIRESWALVNQEASQVVCSGIYDPLNRQVIWNIATGSANIPSLSIVLQTDSVRSDASGTKRGWATWDGNRAKALCMCLFSDNIEAGTARSRTLRPFIGLEGLGLTHICDTGTTDNSVAYTATITTKPYVLTTILDKLIVMAGTVLGKAVSGAAVLIQVVRDFAVETTTGVTAAFTAAGSETAKLVPMDNLNIAEAIIVQVKITDDVTNTARWELHQLALKTTKGQTS